MHTPIDPSRLLGRNSQVHTGTGVITGRIVAVGMTSVTVNNGTDVVKVPSSSLRSIRPA